MSTPLIVEGAAWGATLGAVAAASMAAALYAARPRTTSLAIGLALAASDALLGQLAAITSARWLAAAQAALWIATLAYVVVAILGAIFQADVVDAEILRASLCIFLLMGLFWAYLDLLVMMADPGAFRDGGRPLVGWTDPASKRACFLRLLVFSYSTLASTGFGDVAPATGFANLCANLEALSAQIYLAVVIARLVGVQVVQMSEHRRGHARDEAP